MSHVVQGVRDRIVTPRSSSFIRTGERSLSAGGDAARLRPPEWEERCLSERRRSLDGPSFDRGVSPREETTLSGRSPVYRGGGGGGERCLSERRHSPGGPSAVLGVRSLCETTLSGRSVRRTGGEESLRETTPSGGPSVGLGERCLSARRRSPPPSAVSHHRRRRLSGGWRSRRRSTPTCETESLGRRRPPPPSASSSPTPTPL